jgi:hypothetical protein
VLTSEGEALKLALFASLRLQGYHQGYGDRQKAHAVSGRKVVQ